MKIKQPTSRTPRELLGDLQALVVEAEKMMTDSLSEHSAETFRRLRARFDVARERFAETYAEARKKVVAGAQYTDVTIRSNPYRSLAVAAGVGLLVGALMRRRSS
jgi:ElaB/YqjD/DUF883 family membrane-anchored ribosome-binding protein